MAAIVISSSWRVVFRRHRALPALWQTPPAFVACVTDRVDSVGEMRVLFADANSSTMQSDANWAGLQAYRAARSINIYSLGAARASPRSAALGFFPAPDAEGEVTEEGRCDIQHDGLGSRKTRGMGAGRKLKTHRRRQRWADKAYKKSHLGNEWKKPFAGSSHAKIACCRGIEAKQPNSAIRKCARVQLIKNGKKIAAFVPNDGCLNFIEENDEVLIAGFGRKGHAVGDIPGVRFKVVKVSGVSLLALFKEKKEKPRS
ncbi:40S ribosomal protein S23 [Musa troglodytarum]|uniref:40S ribosomal protein S23 n=1 Tax=Musa troglodytarum TaxID=320322 RepID=A0A9E7ICI9_9LILI|nr:40S ribosomal protein S23 [Musa troglodytarum]